MTTRDRDRRAPGALRGLLAAISLAIACLLPATSPAIEIRDVTNDPGTGRAYFTGDNVFVPVTPEFIQSTTWNFAGAPADCQENRQVLMDPAIAPDWPDFQAAGATAAEIQLRLCDFCRSYRYFDDVRDSNGNAVELREHGRFDNFNAPVNPFCPTDEKHVYGGTPGFRRELLFGTTVGAEWFDVHGDDFAPGGERRVRNDVVAEGTVITFAGVFEAIVVRSRVVLDAPPVGLDHGEDRAHVEYTWWTDGVGMVAAIRSMDGERKDFFDTAARVYQFAGGNPPTVSIDEPSELELEIGSESSWQRGVGINVTLDLNAPFDYSTLLLPDTYVAEIVDPGASPFSSRFSGEYPAATLAVVETPLIGDVDVDFFSSEPDMLTTWGTATGADQSLIDTTRLIFHPGSPPPAANPERRVVYPLNINTPPWSDSHASPDRFIDGLDTPEAFVGTIDKQVIDEGPLLLPNGDIRQVIVVEHHVTGGLFLGAMQTTNFDYYEYFYIEEGFGPVLRVRTVDDVGGVIPGDGDNLAGATVRSLLSKNPTGAGPPTDFQVTDASGCTTLELSWTNSTDPDPVEYEVEYDTDPAFSAPMIDVVPENPSGTTTYSLPLDLGTRYYIRVRALDLNTLTYGDYGPVIRSNLDQVIEPTFLGAVMLQRDPDCSSLLLEWIPAMDNCPGPILYNVYERFITEPIDVTDPDYQLVDTAALRLEGRDPNQTYCFIVHAQDLSGNEDSNMFELCETPGLPLNVTGIAGNFSHSVASAYTRFTLDWTVMAGSGRVDAMTMSFDAAYMVRFFTDDGDGVVGTLTAMPGGTWNVLALSGQEAFVDVNGDGSFDPSVDHGVARADSTFTISFAPGPDTAAQTTTYRLSLQKTMLALPAVPRVTGGTGPYENDVLFITRCGNIHQEMITQDVISPACSPTTIIAPAADPNLRVSKVAGTDLIRVTWLDPGVADACFDNFTLFGTDDPRLGNPLMPTEFRARWVNLNDDDTDGLDQNDTFIGGVNLTYLVVTMVGPDGELGPVGHYGL